MDDLSEQFLAWCQQERKPLNTQRALRRTLNTVDNAGSATREEIEAWWATRRDLSAGTRANDLANLRTFYKWCARWEHRADNPTLRLDPPRVDRGVPRPIDKPDLLKLLDELPPDLRRAVALGAYAGLRVSEAAALMWTEVDQELRRIVVLASKGGKSRAIRVAPLLIDDLLPDTGGNVVSGTAQVYSAGTLQRRVNRAIRACGIRATFHQLRHRFGTRAYQETGDLLAVARAMGHSSVVTTSVYAEASTEVADRIAMAVIR